MKSTLPILALAVGAFGIGVNEFAPMGMLPVIAADLGVSIPRRGPVDQRLCLRRGARSAAHDPDDRPRTAPDPADRPDGHLHAGQSSGGRLDQLRHVAGGPTDHLAEPRCLFGVGAIVAAGLVPENKRAGAVAAMFMGLTIANVVGVPLATWAGDQIGWRVSFWGIAGLGILAMIALRLTLPNAAAPTGGNALAEVKVLGRGPVLAALVLTVIGASAMFTVFTYITPILQQETHASIGFVTAMLVTYGVGLTVGNWLGGKFADKSVDRTLIVTLGSLTALLVAFAFAMPFAGLSAVLIFLWGVASFALVPPLQMRVMAAAADAPNLASAVNIGAFNLGNAIGAALGGGVISAGLGFPAVALAGAAASATGLMLLLLMRRSALPQVIPTALMTDRYGPNLAIRSRL